MVHQETCHQKPCADETPYTLRLFPCWLSVSFVSALVANIKASFRAQMSDGSLVRNQIRLLRLVDLVDLRCRLSCATNQDTTVRVRSTMQTTAAASDFGYEKAARQERLLSELVYEVSGKEPGEEEHDVALDACLHQAKHHRFADTEPKQIERLFSDLGDRMLSLAQYQKQRCMAALVAGIKDIELQSDTIEVHHRILSMLYYSSGRPLNAAFEPGALTVDLLEAGRPQEARQEEILQAFHEAGGFAEGIEEEGFSSGSELSDWSDVKGSLDEERSEAEDVEGIEPSAAADGTDSRVEEIVGRLLPMATIYAKAPQLELRGNELPETVPGCLFQKLADSRFRDLPFAIPLPNKCTSETSLASQVISIFRGSKRPGPAFTWDARVGVHRVAEGVHVPSLSSGMLKDLLQNLAAAGSIAVRLRGVVEGTQLGCLTDASVVEAPTWTAFVSATGKQLWSVNEHIIAVEQQLQQQQQQPVGHLLLLHQALQGPMTELRLLESIFTVAAESQGAESASERSAALLTELHRLLSLACSQSSPQGEAQAACLLKLLSAALRPLLDALNSWLGDARLPTAHQEFFIQHSSTIGTGSKDFWEAAYTLKTTSSGQTACPDFLQPFAQEILDSGKSLVLLRQQQGDRQEQAGDVCGSTPSSNEGDQGGHMGSRPATAERQAAIYAHYLSSLKTLLRESEHKAVESRKTCVSTPEEDTFLEPSALPIAARMQAASSWRLPAADILRLDAAGSGSGSSASSVDRSTTGDQHSASMLLREPAKPDAHQQESFPPLEEGAQSAGDEGAEGAWKDDPRMRGWLGKISGCMERPQLLLRSSVTDGGTILDFTREGSAAAGLPGARRRGSREQANAAAAVEEEDSSLQQCRLQNWLDAQSSFKALPCQTILQRCLVECVQSRVHHTGSHLLQELLGSWQLSRQLRSLRDLYLGGAPVLLPFMYEVVGRLLEGELLTDIHDADLQAALEGCLRSGGHLAPLPHLTAFSATVDRVEHKKIMDSLAAAEIRRKAKLESGGAPSAERMDDELPRTLVELKALSLDCRLSWPLALVVDPAAMRLYNTILTFMMQLMWAREAVRGGQMYGARNQPFSPLHPLGHRMLHLINSLQHFVMHSLASAWQPFQDELMGVDSVQAVRRAHMRFLETAAQPCMATSDGSWHVIHSVLRKLLDLCLQFHELAPVVQDAVTSPEGLRGLARLQAEFADRHRYLLKSLRAKSLKIGDQSGLQYLVMLLDFNSHCD